MDKILRRAITIIPAVIVQILWMFFLIGCLSNFATLIQFLLTIFSVLFVLYIITKRDEGTYKILWLLIMLSFPLPGALLYLFVGNQRMGRPLREKLEKSGKEMPTLETEAKVYESMEKENLRLTQTFKEIERQGHLPMVEAEDVTYYSIGETLYERMLLEMKKAEKFLFVEYFIIEPGKMWDTMVEIMEEKVKAGVDVRVMYDDMGSLSTYTDKNLKDLRAKGIKCMRFNPVIAIKGTLNYRDHRKMLIIDGTTAFSGGVNLADEYINEVEKYGHWKDIGFCMKGAGVDSYTHMFIESWNAFSDSKIDSASHMGIAKASTPEKKDGYVLSYYDNPLDARTTSNDLYADLLSQATTSAWFYTPYLMPGDALLDAFVHAAHRGVDVRLIIPGIPDKKLVYRMSQSYYQPLLEAGVKIYEYTPGFIHAKACVIDDTVGTIGTVNLDYRSLFLHFENNTIFYKSSILKDLKKDMEETITMSRERNLTNVKQSFTKWFLDGILRIFAPLC